MGATSVTGVSGVGTSAGNSKGSPHMSLSVNKLIGAHIVAAGKGTCTGTTLSVEIPTLAGAVTDYVVLLTPTTSTVAYVSTALVAGANSWSFVATASSSAVVHWAISKIGV